MKLGKLASQSQMHSYLWQKIFLTIGNTGSIFNNSDGGGLQVPQILNNM